MVDVTEKKETTRTAYSHRERSKSMMKSLRKSKKEVWQKGMSWVTARVAGIMAAKKTFESDSNVSSFNDYKM